jgi:hypothetical protein
MILSRQGYQPYRGALTDSLPARIAVASEGTKKHNFEQILTKQDKMHTFQAEFTSTAVRGSTYVLLRLTKLFVTFPAPSLQRNPNAM